MTLLGRFLGGLLGAVIGVCLNASIVAAVFRVCPFLGRLSPLTYLGLALGFAFLAAGFVLERRRRYLEACRRLEGEDRP